MRKRINVLDSGRRSLVPAFDIALGRFIDSLRNSYSVAG